MLAASNLYDFTLDYPQTGGPIRWNFTKFLVDRAGNVIARFEPDVRPDSPEQLSAIERALK